MFSMQIDRKGDYDIRWPRAAALLELGRAYVAKEAALPLEQQVREPGLERVRQVLEEAETASSSALDGEAARATSAESFRQALAQAIPLLEQALLALKVKYAANLAQLESWGLQTRVKGRKIHVVKPVKQSEWRSFLQAYVAREASLEPSARIAEPPLEALQALAVTTEESRSARESGRSRRAQGVAGRGESATLLVDLLQVCAAVLVCRYGCRVTRDLQDWGFEIVAHSSRVGSAAPAAEEAARG